MPMPLWWGQINKRVFNPRAMNNPKWAVLNHVGRVSGATHRTPLEAHPVDGGFLFVVVYGPKTDWLRNVLAAGSAKLEFEGRTVPLASPRMVAPEEALELLPSGTKPPPALLKVKDYLRMDLVGTMT